MSDTDSRCTSTEDSDSEGSLADFIVHDEEVEADDGEFIDSEEDPGDEAEEEEMGRPEGMEMVDVDCEVDDGEEEEEEEESVAPSVATPHEDDMVR